ncbi:C6 transcription factor [Colletotrichum tofieldiae]|nr:C6 transcription factor [Colletotrichum tofieldiae]
MIREAGTAVRAPDMPPSDDWRFYLDLCLAGLEDLDGAAASGDPDGESGAGAEAAGEIEKQHAASQGMTDKVEARWIIDFDLAMTDPEAAQGRNLVEQLEGLMLNEMRLDDPG